MDSYQDAYNEKELLILAKKGDKDAFSSLIEPNYKMLYSVSYSILGNSEDAKDVAQEAALIAYKRINTFRDKSKFSTWLYRIVLNKAKDFLRDRSKRESVALEKVENTLVSTQNYDDKLMELDLRQALQKLSVEQRELIVLRDVRNLSYEEIAIILEKNLGTVKSGISRAREAFAGIVKDMGLLCSKEGRDGNERK